jgi:DNA-binding NarL/FixJ family response regulator
LRKEKIRIAIAEDRESEKKIIVDYFNRMPNYEVQTIASNGRELILKLSRAIKLPQIILMDMQMPCCDGLLTTIICKALFPQIKIVGLSSHTSSMVINEFLAEGGDGFLTKHILIKGSITYRAYKDENVFEKALHQILNNHELYIDILSDYKKEEALQLNTSKAVLSRFSNKLTQNQMLYLQLNAAGFSRVQIAALMHKSVDTIKKYCKEMCSFFETDNHTDLANICFSLGIAKLVTLYQSIPDTSFSQAISFK